MSQRDEDLIEHILDAAAKLAEIVTAGRDYFDASWLMRSAAERQLEIIGEAAGNSAGRRWAGSHGRRHEGFLIVAAPGRSAVPIAWVEGWALV